MRYLVSALLCLTTPLLAESIQNVEFQLPKSQNGWEVGNKMENEQATTVIYQEKGQDKGMMPNGWFGANYSKLKSDPKDTASIENALKNQLPDKKVEFAVLSQDDNSLLYEWGVKDGEKEIMHGWGRGFSTKDGTVVLGYQTINVNHLDSERSNWLPVLKNAKVVN